MGSLASAEIWQEGRSVFHVDPHTHLGWLLHVLDGDGVLRPEPSVHFSHLSTSHSNFPELILNPVCMNLNKLVTVCTVSLSFSMASIKI